MSIQFFCPSCGQPIEVDDEMANQTVTCPYCRSAAQTPGTSDPRVRSSAPSADSVEGPATAPVATVAPVTDGMAYGQPAPENKSVLGWVALGCVVVAGISFVIIVIVGMNAVQGLQMSPQASPEEFQQEVAQRMAQYPWVQPLGLVGVCCLPLVGLICAIITLVRKASPRWPAIVALALAGVLVLLVCAGMVLQGMQAAQQAGP